MGVVNVGVVKVFVVLSAEPPEADENQSKTIPLTVFTLSGSVPDVHIVGEIASALNIP